MPLAESEQPKHTLLKAFISNLSCPIIWIRIIPSERLRVGIRWHLNVSDLRPEALYQA